MPKGKITSGKKVIIGEGTSPRGSKMKNLTTSPSHSLLSFEYDDDGEKVEFDGDGGAEVSSSYKMESKN